ncbi:MAG TPA: hypothetical protein VMT61_13810 [Candidatus Binataceae bacterium]|nr:hypothetical protein [Candidatus Binataceae bacterium]
MMRGALRDASVGYGVDLASTLDNDQWLADLAKRFATIEGEPDYNLEWEPPRELASQWAARQHASLQFFSRLLDELPKLTGCEIEARITWWSQDENRILRKAMEQTHRRRCERGKGILVNRVTGEVIKARFTLWHE